MFHNSYYRQFINLMSENLFIQGEEFIHLLIYLLDFTWNKLFCS